MGGRFAIAGWVLPVFAGLVVAPATGRTAAQGTPGAERAADVVTVDFMAVTRDGAPVADLAASEVTVRIDGRTRPLRSLRYVPFAGAAAPDTDAGAPMPAPFGSNAPGSDGRLFYLVIDDDSFRAGREGPLREAVDRFTRALAPRDRLALVTMPYGGVKVPPTTDHSRVRIAINTIVGQAPASESGSDFACRTRRTLEALLGLLLDTLGAGESPRTVIFVSSGLAGPRRDNAPMLAPGMCELTVDLFRQVGEAAGAARARFYLVMPEDVAVRPGVSRPQNIAGIGAESDNPFEGLENLAGVTGAHRMYLTGLPETALGRIARETSGHYVALLTPAGSDRNGRNHQLDVRVERPGIVVRSRPEIRFAAAVGALPASVREMVSVRRAFADLPLRVAAYVSQDHPGKVKVVAVVDAGEPVAKLATLAAVLFDGSGQPAAQWIGSGAEITGPPVTLGLLTDPGLYRLRVGAIDDRGRGGAVDWEVDATLTPAGPLRLSSLMLGLSREGGFTPRLQFGSEPVAIGYVEVYGGAAGMRVVAALEVARTLNGPAILAVPLALSQAAGRHIATGAVPIGALPDGDYAVRAIIGVEGQPAGRVVQILRKATK